jgi:hypothetical protein
MKFARVIVALLIVDLVGSPVAAQQTPPAADESPAVGRTPPRLSFLDGDVSFWRPGADGWAPAQINTSLAPGDALYTARAANLELQIGPRAYVRTGEDTQLGIENQEPDFLQLKVTTGHASLDLRGLAAGHTIELDTPNAAFTVETTGYYRLDVSETTTTFVARRGGRATMTPAGGAAVAITPSEQVVIQGGDVPRVETYVAPELDAWDHWNYDRTDQLIDAMSARYVASGVYGLDDLDQYGDWRIVSQYGPVWVPDAVAPGWVPYSTGRWLWDPYYGWTWLDYAPWGWAPYHYGRWVYFDRLWAWAPGPVVVTPVYAPALVAFFGGGGFGVRLGFGTPAIGWCALGWGEPLVPWWGHRGFIGRPWWAGWGGPRIVNNVVINRTTIVNVNKLNLYQNMHVPHAVVVERRDRFGQGLSAQARLPNVDVRHLEPLHGDLPVHVGPASLVPAGHGARPPEAVLRRPVVATRAPHDPFASLRAGGVRIGSAIAAPAPRLVGAPQHGRPPLSSRPSFGQSGSVERPRPPLPQRFEGTWQSGQQSRQAPAPGAPGGTAPRHYELGPSAPRSEAPRVQSAPPAPPSVQAPRAPGSRPPGQGGEAPRGTAPRGGVPQAQMPRAPAPELPGEPANRVYPGRMQAQPRSFGGPGAPAPAPHTGRGSSGGQRRGSRSGHGR